MKTDNQSIHPVIYRCPDFIYYLEVWQGLPFLHMTLIRFSHNVFKELKKVARQIAGKQGLLFGYAEEESTLRLLHMAGFKETDIQIINANGIRRALCLQL